MAEDRPSDEKRTVLGRVFDILDCFGRDEPEQTVATLCARTGLPPATVHRILASLVEWDAVERTSRGCYRLGRRLWRLGHWVPEVRTLREVARPYLVDLFSTSGAPVMLAAWQLDRVVLLDRIAGRRHNGVWPYSQSWEPSEHASGLVMLAGTPYSGGEAPVVAGQPDARRQLAEIRRLGYAVSQSDSPLPLTWVASGITGKEQGVALAVVVAIPRMERVSQSLVHLVRTTSRAISIDLGRTAGRLNGEE